jgi:hypothetical protein
VTAFGPDNEAPVCVPGEVVADAKAAFRQRPRAKGEVAALSFDSLVDDEAPASDHELRFEHQLVHIDVHVSASRSGAVLTGEVSPPVVSRIELQLDGAELSFREELAEGTFRFQQIPHGLTRLTLAGSAVSPNIHTDWFRV